MRLFSLRKLFYATHVLRESPVKQNKLFRHANLLQAVSAIALAASTLGLSSCGTNAAQSLNTTYGVLDVYKLTGDVSLVHDPTIIRQGSQYYVLGTDAGQTGNLLIRCSSDKINWKICGSVFATPPPEVLAVFPALVSLWAPDVSYFNGLYHVYYAASGFGANHSLIGLATSPTMNPSDPNYKWTDQGIVLSSQTTSNFNAIDPNILVDTDSNGNVTHVWLTYGSFWNGIFQREINPTTGMLSTTNTTVTNLAMRPAVSGDPIEGPSLVKHNGYYYLFVSFGSCCNANYTTDNYQIAVGRSTSPNGPLHRSVRHRDAERRRHNSAEHERCLHSSWWAECLHRPYERRSDYLPRPRQQSERPWITSS